MRIRVIFLFIAVCFSVITYGSNNLSNIKSSGSENAVLIDRENNISKKISLIKLDLNNDHYNELKARLDNLKTNKYAIFDNEKSVFNLGMANVPVLDQEDQPTCVTFAVSSLLNSEKKAGNFISQQCLLQLSETFATYYCPSAWDGSWSTCIFKQVNNYGVVDNNNCPDKYPNRYAGAMDFNKHHELSNKGQWSSEFSMQQVTTPNNIYSIKQLLKNNKRVLVAFLINKYSNAGDPIYEYKNGLWNIPAGTTMPEQVCGYNLQDCAGHAVVITGYDNNEKVFKIRNSWGDKFGASGEFFMSYDYLSVMVQRAYTISLNI